MRVSISIPFHAHRARCTYLFDVIGVGVSVGMGIRSSYRRRVVRRTRARADECGRMNVRKMKRLFILFYWWL